MATFNEIKARLTNISGYFGIKLSNMVIAGQTAKKLGMYRNNGSPQNYEDKIVIFLPLADYNIVRTNIMSKNRKNKVFVEIEGLECLFFEQTSTLGINIIDNLKFLDSNTLAEYYIAVPDSCKQY